MPEEYCTDYNTLRAWLDDLLDHADRYTTDHLGNKSDIHIFSINLYPDKVSTNCCASVRIRRENIIRDGDIDKSYTFETWPIAMTQRSEHFWMSEPMLHMSHSLIPSQQKSSFVDLVKGLYDIACHSDPNDLPLHADEKRGSYNAYVNLKD